MAIEHCNELPHRFSREYRTPPIIQKFEEIFESLLINDRALYEEPDSHFRTYRSLKETLRSNEFNRLNIKYIQFYVLVDHLLDSQKFGEVFKEWIVTREFDWEMGILPTNARIIYKFGKNEILKRSGKKY